MLVFLLLWKFIWLALEVDLEFVFIAAGLVRDLLGDFDFNWDLLRDYYYVLLVVELAFKVDVFYLVACFCIDSGYCCLL